MPKDSSAKYYQKNIKRLQKKVVKYVNGNKLVSDAKIYQKMKNKNCRVYKNIL